MLGLTCGQLREVIELNPEMMINGFINLFPGSPLNRVQPIMLDRKDVLDALEIQDNFDDSTVNVEIREGTIFVGLQDGYIWR